MFSYINRKRISTTRAFCYGAEKSYFKGALICFGEEIPSQNLDIYYSLNEVTKYFFFFSEVNKDPRTLFEARKVKSMKIFLL